jgi:hypothetical protein
MSRKIMRINSFANQCGYFYNAYIEKEITINNGYNCSHPEQEEIETVNGQKIGSCHCFSCPLGYEADEEDFKNQEIDNNGYEENEEGEFIVVEE